MKQQRKLGVQMWTLFKKIVLRFLSAIAQDTPEELEYCEWCSERGRCGDYWEVCPKHPDYHENVNFKTNNDEQNK